MSLSAFQNEDENLDEDGAQLEDKDHGTPKGKVHMETEHDVKFDSDVILAVSVMSAIARYVIEKIFFLKV